MTGKLGKSIIISTSFYKKKYQQFYEINFNVLMKNTPTLIYLILGNERIY